MENRNKIRLASNFSNDVFHYKMFLNYSRYNGAINNFFRYCGKIRSVYTQLFYFVLGTEALQSACL